MNDEKLAGAVALLRDAIRACKESPTDPLLQAALAKAFESAFEYQWKAFKREAQGAGLEVYSPRDAIRAAAQMRLIDEPAVWNDFLNARNLSVHDYVGMDDVKLRAVVEQFYEELVRRGSDNR